MKGGWRYRNKRQLLRQGKKVINMVIEIVSPLTTHLNIGNSIVESIVPKDESEEIMMQETNIIVKSSTSLPSLENPTTGMLVDLSSSMDNGSVYFYAQEDSFLCRYKLSFMCQ